MIRYYFIIFYERTIQKSLLYYFILFLFKYLFSPIYIKYQMSKQDSNLDPKRQENHALSTKLYRIYLN